MTGGVPIGSLDLSKQFTAVIKDLTRVIGGFGALDPVLRRGDLESPLVGCSGEFVSRASGSLLEEGGYLLGVRQFADVVLILKDGLSLLLMGGYAHNPNTRDLGIPIGPFSRSLSSLKRHSSPRG